MNKNDIFDHRQPVYVWMLLLCIPIVMIALLCISGMYRGLWYIMFFLLFIVAICDATLKYREILDMRKANIKVRWLSNKFLKESGFLPFAIGLLCLGWGVMMKNPDIVVLIIFSPALFTAFFLMMIDIRGLIILLRRKGDQEAQ